MPTLCLKRLLQVSLLTAVAISTGCSSEKPRPSTPPAPTALSLAEWKALPVVEKYDGGALERLRMHDPKLRSDKAWDRFMRKYVMPDRKIDIAAPPVAVRK